MYYDTYRNKRSGRRGRSDRHPRQSCLGMLFGLVLRLLLIALILAAIVGGALYVMPVSALGSHSAENYGANTGLPSDRVNILLLGVDELKDNRQRSDTMIIASVGTDSVKLVSVMRDTMVEIPGHGKNKLNAAYSFGGPEMTMRCINENFGLNITRYIVADYMALVKLIDAVGGIDIKITEAELEQINRNVGHSARIFKPLGYDAEPLIWKGSAGEESVEYHLNGLFTLGYARIRKIDSDYGRAFRQRKVIMALKKSVKSSLLKASMYPALIDVLNTSVKTNMSVWELLSIAEKALFSGEIINEGRTPSDAYLTDNGSNITIRDRAANTQLLYDTLYRKKADE